MGWVHCVVFSDISPTTFMDTPLNREELKQIFNLEETFSCRARYHTVIIPAHRPRIFSWNVLKHFDGTINWGGVLMRMGMFGAACLADGDQSALDLLDEDAYAQAARMCILRVEDTLIRPVTAGCVARSQPGGLAAVEIELHREQDLLASATA